MYRINPLLSVILLILIMCPSFIFGQTPKLWGSLQPGKFNAGFTTIYFEDESRSFFTKDTLNITGRPIRVMIWYPATRSGEDMTIDDYININIDHPYESFNEFFTQIEYGKMARLQSPNKEMADSLLHYVLDKKAFARSNADHATGRYPLILHSLGRNSSQLESFVLWEYLASHGYVIAVIPQLGSTPQKFNSLSWTKEDLGVQKLDLEFTLSKMMDMNFIDSTHVGFIGYSSGGVIGTWIAASTNKIDQLITLDGTQTTSDGVNMLDSLGISSSEINLPFLNIYNSNNHLLNTDFMDEVPDKNLINIKMNEVTHFDFNQWPLYYYIHNIPDERGIRWRDPDNAAESYLLMVQLVEIFLSDSQKFNSSRTQEKLNAILQNNNLAEIKF